MITLVRLIDILTEHACILCESQDSDSLYRKKVNIYTNIYTLLYVQIIYANDYNTRWSVIHATKCCGSPNLPEEWILKNWNKWR